MKCKQETFYCTPCEQYKVHWTAYWKRIKKVVGISNGLKSQIRIESLNCTLGTARIRRVSREEGAVVRSLRGQFSMARNERGNKDSFDDCKSGEQPS